MTGLITFNLLMSLIAGFLLWVATTPTKTCFSEGNPAMALTYLDVALDSGDHVEMLNAIRQVVTTFAVRDSATGLWVCTLDDIPGLHSQGVSIGELEANMMEVALLRKSVS